MTARTPSSEAPSQAPVATVPRTRTRDGDQAATATAVQPAPVGGTGQDIRSRRGLFAAFAGLGVTAAACSIPSPGGNPPATATPTMPVPPGTTAPPGTSPGPTTSPSATVPPGSTPTPTTPPPPAVPPSASTPSYLRTRDPVVHFLGRASFGATPALVAEVKRIGVGAWLDQQLQPASIADGTADGLMTRFAYLGKSNQELWAIEGDIDYDLVIGLGTATLARQVWSNRQLLERMVDFWQAHVFNKGYPNGEIWRDLYTDDREVMRPRALGRFADLLLAETTSPAMIRRLNADRSTAKALNENLGRELLELHTVGVQAGYTQAEVIDSARILTGISIDSTTRRYVYKPANHYVGPVLAAGFTSANATADGGEAVMRAYLDHLARHPSTAQNLARKLATYFVSDVPPASLVTKLAEVYLASDTAIGPVLRALFTSPEFGAAIGLKTRAPLEDEVATLRVLGIGPPAAGIEPLSSLYWIANDMGMAPLGWPAPEGYPMTAARWVSPSATIGRWDLHRNLLNGWWPKGLGTPAVSALLGTSPPATVVETIDVLTNRLTFQAFDAAHRQALVTWLGGNASRATASNEYLVAGLAALVLDSPYHTYA